MTSISFTSISFPRPTKALLNLNDRSHWAAKAKDVRRWRAATRVAVYRAGLMNLSQDPAIVCITIDVPDKRRRDPANIWVQKPIVDALVDCCWWPDDTPEYVTVVEPVLRHVGTKAPLMVEVTLVPR